MATLMGYWGITRDREMRSFTNEKADVTEYRLSGPGYTVVAVSDQLIAQRPLPIATVNGTCGWLVGSLFSEMEAGEFRTVETPLDSPKLLSHPDRELARQRWGSFALAIVVDEGRGLILGRDALGLSRCYFASDNGAFAFASRLDVLVDILGKRPSLDWRYLASCIVHGPLPVRRCPLEGVRQVPPGTLVRLDASGVHELAYWNPFKVAAEIGDVPSGEEVRQTLKACVAAWVRGSTNAVVSLSGGLDSSSIAWALQDHPAAVAIHLDVGTIASADEYEYARLVAERYKLRLHHIKGAGALPLSPVETSPERWDEPSSQLLHQRYDEIQSAIGGPGAVHVSGSGGDQVFNARVDAPLQLHDELLTCGIGFAIRSALTYSRREGLPLVSLFWSLITSEALRLVSPTALARRVPFTMPAPGWLTEPHRCGPDCPSSLVAELAAVCAHIPSGKARHATEIAFAQGIVGPEPRHPGGPPPAYPMLSVPLVEMALRTPMHALIGAERDRILLRDAMAPVLPDQVVMRQDKGEYAGMYQLGLRRNFNMAKELIVDGYASSAGIIDASGAVDDLSASALGASHQFWPLVSLLAVETWCRAWSTT